MTRRLRRPLRRTIGRTAVAVAAVVLLGVAVVYVVTDRMMDSLSTATDRFVEEQQIAHRIEAQVVRQLVAASTGASRGDPDARRAFTEAGERVYDRIQEYLFRTLDSRERLQLETIKRSHQRLEVAAVQATELEARGDPVAADSARTRMFAHATDLLEEIESFMRMREEGLERIRAEQTTLVQRLFLLTAAVALALLGGSLLAGRFLHRRVSEPLARLVEASDRVGRGDLDVRIVPTDEDEIGAVADAFNRMAENLSAAQERLGARNQDLAEALAEIQATQEELVQAEKMSALGRMTAGLAHELNNPLASVLSFAELLEAELRHGTSPEPETIRHDFVEPLLQEARRARSLVQNLLGFSRKSVPTLGPVPLRASLDVVVGMRRYVFEQAGLQLERDSIPDVHVRAERQRLQDAFLNIVNNAFEAMRAAGVEEGALRIHGAVDDACVRLVFDDDGPGFAEPDRAFEPFYTTKPVGEGTGIGLALVHRFFEECGGRIEASRAPGGGARVEVELPVADAPILDGTPGRPAAGTDEARPEERVYGSPAVLVVEDEAHLRRVHERLLLRLGARPLLAASAAAAKEILEREDVDLVISDIRMPHESGIDLYHWIEDRVPRLSERVLFVTGDVHNPETRELAARRPELFIQKPFEMDEYLRRVGALLGEPSDTPPPASFRP